MNNNYFIIDSFIKSYLDSVDYYLVVNTLNIYMLLKGIKYLSFPIILSFLTSCGTNISIDNNSSDNNQRFTVHNLTRSMSYERNIINGDITIGNRILYKPVINNLIEEGQTEPITNISDLNRSYNSSQWLETQNGIISIGADISNSSSEAIGKATPLTFTRNNDNVLFIETGFEEIANAEQYVSISTQPSGRVSIIAYRGAFTIKPSDSETHIVEQGRFSTFNDSSQDLILANIPFEEDNQLDYTVESINAIQGGEGIVEIELSVPAFINVYVGNEIVEVNSNGTVYCEVNLSNDSSITLIAPNGEERVINVDSLSYS